MTDFIVLDDRHEYFSYTSQCAMCKYFHGSCTCKAFPKGIPIDLLSGESVHNKIRKGQVGTTVYELNKELDE